jgi:hypothetical protein
LDATGKEREEIQMEQTENVVEETTQVEDKPLSFDEILGDKTYQAEFDRRVQKALETARSKWEAEEQTKRTEAEKLAKMDAEQKAKYELKKERERADEALAKLNAYELKSTAIKIAQEKGLDISLLEDIDYSKQTAETITTIIDTKKAVFDKAIEKAMNDKYKEKSPININSDVKSETKMPSFF